MESSNISILDWVSQQWLLLTKKITVSDQAIFTIGTYGIHQMVSLFFSIFFCLAHYFDWFPAYRIQNANNVDRKLLKVCIKDYLKRALVTEAPTLLLLYYGFRHFGTVVRGPLPNWPIILRDWLVCFLWTETTFYWSHRLFHHPLLYKRIHKQHHEFKKSMAVNTEYAHPLEHLIGNVFTTMGGPLLMGSHVLVFWSYLLFRLWETFDAHSGYALLSPFSAISFWTGPEMHDFHHSHNVGCFGTMTCFWDYVCGTDKAYRQHLKKLEMKEKQQDKKSVSEKNGVNMDDVVKEDKKKMHEIKSQ